MPRPSDRVYVNEESIVELGTDVTAEAAAYNARHGTMEAAAAAAEARAQALNDLSLGTAVKAGAL